MSVLLYALSKIFAGLVLFAILFGVVLMVLASGILLDEGAPYRCRLDKKTQKDR